MIRHRPGQKAPFPGRILQLHLSFEVISEHKNKYIYHIYTICIYHVHLWQPQAKFSILPFQQESACLCVHLCTPLHRCKIKLVVLFCFKETTLLMTQSLLLYMFSNTNIFREVIFTPSFHTTHTAG